MGEHTPTPWNCASRYSSIVGVPIVNQQGKRIGNTALPDMPAEWDHLKRQAEIDAAFIVKAVNNHDTLLCVVRQLIEAVDSGNLQMSSPEIGEPENNIPIHQWHEELLHYARAALASIKERA